VTHQLALDGDWGAGGVEPGAIRVTEGVPSDQSQACPCRGWLDLSCGYGLLPIWHLGGRVREDPPLFRLGTLGPPTLHQLGILGIERKIVLRVLGLHVIHPTMHDPKTTTGKLLQLGTGTGGLKEFFSHYVDEIEKFKAAGMQRAVIVPLDNDSGANEILLLLNKITKTVHTRTAPYIHVSGNLYVVLTPLVAGQQESMIEDFFQDTVVKVVLGGKTFSAVNGKGFDSTKHFGKEILSRYVEENAHNIDFSNFTGILDRIRAAIESHAAKLAPPLAAKAAATP
jgi:hypothetical protein